MKITMRVSLPGRVNFTAATAELEKGLKKFVEKQVTPSFNETVKTWQRKPRFLYENYRNQREISSRVYTMSDIYRFVSGGTKVRYATMTSDFMAKTIPNWIGSRMGRGGVAFISVFQPRPGIKAREFDKEIAKYWQPRMENSMRQTINRAAQASGHIWR
jgi:hypothetical protein